MLCRLSRSKTGHCSAIQFATAASSLHRAMERERESLHPDAGSLLQIAPVALPDLQHEQKLTSMHGCGDVVMLKFYLKYLGCVILSYPITCSHKHQTTSIVVDCLYDFVCMCFVLHSSYQLAATKKLFMFPGLPQLVRQWALAAAIIRELFFGSTRATSRSQGVARCWLSNRKSVTMT